MAREVLRELDLEWKDLWGQLRWPLAAAILMGFVMISVREFIPHDDIYNAWVRLIVGTISGAVTYGLTLWLFGRKIVEELCEVFLWVFRPSRPIVSE